MNEPQFVGSLSFERRAIAAVLDWGKATPVSGTVRMLDYGDNATTGEEARQLREEVWNEIVDRLPDRHSLQRIPVRPYSIRDVMDVLDDAARTTQLSVDITCFTRPHVMGAARWFALNSDPPWDIRYTSPLGYGSLGSPYPDYGWKDSLILPLGADSSLDNQGLLLGILLLGFDLDRMSVAFDELESDAGVVAVCKTPDRPDFHRTAIAQSRVLTDHLRSLSIGGTRGEIVARGLGGDGWHFEQIDLDRVIDDSRELVHRVVTAAQSVESPDSRPAPVVLYPFGPKIAVFTVAYELVRTYSEFSWAAYPVPVSHPINYSTGIGQTAILSGTEFGLT